MISVDGDLQANCCEQMGISQDAFEKTALLTCLPPWFQLLGHLRWYFDRSYFEMDCQIIHNLAGCRCRKEAMDTYANCQVVQGFQRGVLGFRITKNRVRYFSRKYLEK